MPDSGTKLSDVVRVRPSGIRSINIERDLLEPALAMEYVLTAQARQTLSRIVDGVEQASLTRAWTLTGPYGSGKSYFGLFLMNLLEADAPAHAALVERLGAVDAPLAERVERIASGNGTKGFLPVPITGHRAQLQEAFVHGLCQALQPLGQHAPIHDLLARVDEVSQAGSRALIHWLQEIQAAIAEPALGYRGLLVILDEMGKLLEYTAAHHGFSDIYLLQELAEYANRSKETPVLFLGVLHQAFERYAGNLDSATQREWAKVQGRFEDIAFQEPPDQQMRLLVSALEHRDLLNDPAPADQDSAVNGIIDAGWLPPLLGAQEFARLCEEGYPLHPTSLVALPYLFRRLAQNERSIFAYLASQEPFGFQEFLQGHALPDTVRLSHLFDYLTANFQGRLYASLRARPLTEALERLNNGHCLSRLSTDLMKSVGLLNWLGEVSPFQATEERLMAALRSEEYSDEKIREALESLRLRSLIVHRRFNRTYAIWQGSDVDIEQRLEEARRKLSGVFSLADAVQQYLPPRPAVARRHSYETGTVRYFEIRYVDHQLREHLSLELNPGASGLLLICLPTNPAETEAFEQWASDPAIAARDYVVICIAERTGRLTELVAELRCLEWVRENTPELRDDPVARRELRTREAMVETLVRNELDRTLAPARLSEGVRGRWFQRGAELPLGASLSQFLSARCDALYSKSPKIWNELLNRRQLSSQGAAARRNLIEAMLTRGGETNLGIGGYPPERSMYESLLKAGGIHQDFGHGTWKVSSPPLEDPLRLQAVWEALDEFIFALPPEPRSVQVLFEKLATRPYGVTDGVLPVLLCAFLLVFKDETTLYREGTLLPEPGVADWEVLLRRPELFAVAGCQVTGQQAMVVQRLARGLRTNLATMPVVRELIRRLRSLPEYAWRTQRVSDRARAVRRVIENARSPERLLFHDLPIALDLPPFAQDRATLYDVDLFFERLNTVLDELTTAMPGAIERARDQLLAACGLPLGPTGWASFSTLATNLSERITHASLTPLVRRVAGASDERVAVESALAFVSDRPPRSWTDSDVDRFSHQVAAIGELFRKECKTARRTQQLTTDQEVRSNQIASELREYLQRRFGDEEQILAAALQSLADEFMQRDQR